MLNIKKAYERLKKEGANDFGIFGLLGNWQKESGLKGNNAQNCGNTSLKMTDAQYTKALDNGSITKDVFVNDHKFGFGLAQWTYPTRKAALYDFMKKNAKSFGDEMKQLEFAIKELKTNYKSVWNVLCTATTIKEASDAVLHKYEQPADQSAREENERCGYGEEHYKEFFKDKVWHCVQLGAFEYEENAKKLLKELQAKGYKDAFITTKPMES